jgi:RimJ/RimL family protein N-acetyltransferase
MPLEGTIIRLREERLQDMPLLVELRNDLETQAWSKTLPPDYTEEMYLKRFNEREFSFDRNEGRFIIEIKETGEFAGIIMYSWLNPRWSAVLGIMVAKKYWGKNIALDAQNVMLKFVFHELGVRVARLFTHSGNQAAIKLAQKSGFQIAAQQREAIFKNGAVYDNVIMDLLREEYYALHPELTDGLPGL